MQRLLIATLSVFCVSCQVSLDYSGTGFLCNVETDCPADQECIAGRCQLPVDDVTDAAPPDAPISASARIGNLLMLTFDEPAGRTNATDRSGARRDGRASAAYVAGRYGNGVSLDGIDDRVDIPSHLALFAPTTITIEMWIQRDLFNAAETLLSNRGVLDGAPTFHLAINGAGQIVFEAGCDDAVSSLTANGASVVAGVWAHIAVVLDGTSAQIYLDGESVGSGAFARAGCVSAGAPMFLGLDEALAEPFAGLIDEVKISDIAKTAPEIRASMSFNSTDLVESCGDGLIEGSEQCDGSDVCCDTTSCDFADDATTCEGAIGSCQAGGCMVPAAVTRDGLVVEYRFDEGAGALVGDTGPGAALDLTIADETLVTWGASGLQLTEAVEIASVGAATKLHNAVTASGALTIEAWVTPANLTQDGPARVVTVSTSTATRNFTVGQDQNKWVSRVRTSQTNTNGTPAAIGPPDAAAALTHLVAVYRAGRSELYVNGILRSSIPLPGDLSTWTASSRIAIGDEFGTSRRDWAGTFHYIAIYSRPMTSLEIAGNLAAGVP